MLAWMRGQCARTNENIALPFAPGNQKLVCNFGATSGFHFFVRAMSYGNIAKIQGTPLHDVLGNSMFRHTAVQKYFTSAKQFWWYLIAVRFLNNDFRFQSGQCMYANKQWMHSNKPMSCHTAWGSVAAKYPRPLCLLVSCLAFSQVKLRTYTKKMLDKIWAGRPE